MFYPNYYPHNFNYNYNYNKNNYYPNPNFNLSEEKKDIDSSEKETIRFKDFNSNENTQSSKIEKQNKLNILGFSFEIDDLIIIGLIILLFLESDKNYALIIILGLILLNVNLNDILNIF
jgi:hypothetical protein